MINNSFYNALGGIIRLIVGIVTIPLLIRAVGVEEYGLWTLASSIIAIMMLAESGLSFSTTFFISQGIAKQDLKELSEILSMVLVVAAIASTTIGLILWFSASYVVLMFPKLGLDQIIVIESSLKLGALTIFLRLIQQVFIGLEQACQYYRLINSLNTIQTLSISGGMLVIAFNHGHTLELMQWQAIVSALFLTLHFYVVKKIIHSLKLYFLWNSKWCLPILKYSSGTWISSLGGVFFGQFDRLLVGSILGIEMLGVYSAITNATVQINSLSAVSVQPLVPILSRLSSQFSDDIEDVKPIIKKYLEINTIVAIGMGSLFLTFDLQIISLVLDRGVASRYITDFRTATIIYSFYSMNSVGYYIMFGTNSIKTCMLIQIFSGIISLSMITFGMYFWGLTGAIIGNVGYCSVWLLNLIGLRQLGIDREEWMKWISIPMVLFSTLSLSSILIQDAVLAKWLICLTCTSSLLVWFNYVNPNISITIRRYLSG